ncbi:hypothetical protein AAY473_003616 [Plecturocebus cupreus]
MMTSASGFLCIQSKRRGLFEKSIKSRRLAAGYQEMENPLSHFLTARISGLEKKPAIPPWEVSQVPPKKEKSREAQNAECLDLIRAVGQRQLAPSVRYPCPAQIPPLQAVGRMPQLHLLPQNQAPSSLPFVQECLMLYRGLMGLALSPRLECSGVTTVSVSSAQKRGFTILSRPVSNSWDQAIHSPQTPKGRSLSSGFGVQWLTVASNSSGSSSPPIPASQVPRTTGAHHHTWLIFIIFVQKLVWCFTTLPSLVSSS